VPRTHGRKALYGVAESSFHMMGMPDDETVVGEVTGGASLSLSNG
jgi:hypothetical protein